jgi:HPt (histidine-containing phosphotransfer) domain-containing protein
MNPEYSLKKFIFNSKIDANYLQSLYEDDYAYIAEIFETSLQDMDADLNAIEFAFESNEPKSLRKAVHKLKPVFGFAGMLEEQQLMQEFETRCEEAENTKSLSSQYQSLIRVIREAEVILRNDLTRLKAFNASHI